MSSISRMLLRVMLAASLCVPVSCRVQENGCPAVCGTEGTGLADVSVAIAGMPEVRSILGGVSVETKITQVSLASYDSSGKLIDTGHSGGEPINLLLSRGGPNSIYALVNMGDVTDMFPVDEADVASVCWCLGSYDDVQEDGIPMCGYADGIMWQADGITVEVERLFAKVLVRVLHTSLKDAKPGALFAYNLCNSSIYVRQANRRLFPFAPASSVSLSPDDVLHQSDYNPDMNDMSAYLENHSPGTAGPGPGYFQDTTMVFYVPENMQGVLLPENTDPQQKVYGRISDIEGTNYGDLCTYIELNAVKPEHGVGYKGSLMYRCYLGSDATSDFSIMRNAEYEVTLDLTEGGFFMDSWKVTRDNDWSDTRLLSFLEEPYIIYPGSGEDAVVHYRRDGQVGVDSHNSPDEWSLVVDEDALAAAGVSCSLDTGTLSAGDNGCKDVRISFSASESAVVGAAVPVSVVSWDGSLVDRTTITVAGLGEMTAAWTSCPEYVSQYGLLDVSGVPDDKYPLTVTPDDAYIASCTRVDDDTFRIVARHPGETVIRIANADGSQSTEVDIAVAAPRLRFSSWEGGKMSADGTSSMTGAYGYVTPDGTSLGDVDEETYNSVLLPVLDCAPYFGCAISSEQASIWVQCLYSDGAQMDFSESYRFVFTASDCPEVEPVTIIGSVQDPFAGMYYGIADYGRIDDYSLFALSGTDAVLRDAFSDELDSTASYVYDAPVPAADPDCISAALVPEWTSVFSNANGVYSVIYDPSSSSSSTGASFEITRNDVTEDTPHSAGAHKVVLYVRNVHSGETVSHTGATAEVYVHTAVGATGTIGSQQGTYQVTGDLNFAQVYNGISASQDLFSESSYSSRIYYMDVSVDFLTDVSEVWLLNRVRSYSAGRNDTYDALGFIQPVVTDGTNNYDQRHLYSVSGNDVSRLAAGEQAGVRKGIGTVLYRVLHYPDTDQTVTEAMLDQWFYGYSASASSPDSRYAPAYQVYDLNYVEGSSPYVVDRTVPYHFSPSEMKGTYTDDDGNGYHVFHFLEGIFPETAGWTGLIGR